MTVLGETHERINPLLYRGYQMQLDLVATFKGRKAVNRGLNFERDQMGGQACKMHL